MAELLSNYFILYISGNIQEDGPGRVYSCGCGSCSYTHNYRTYTVEYGHQKLKFILHKSSYQTFTKRNLFLVLLSSVVTRKYSYHLWYIAV